MLVTGKHWLAHPGRHIDHAAMTALREYERQRISALEAARAAAQPKKPLAVRLMECVACAAFGAAVTCLVIMLAQGFTLYAGATVPPLWSLIDFPALAGPNG